MAPWDLYVLYPTLDVENMPGYPNNPNSNLYKKLPTFDSNPSIVAPMSCHLWEISQNSKKDKRIS